MNTKRFMTHASSALLLLLAVGFIGSKYPEPMIIVPLAVLLAIPMAWAASRQNGGGAERYQECLRSINSKNLTYQMDSCARDPLALELKSLMETLKENLKDQVKIAREINDAVEGLAAVSSQLDHSMDSIADSSGIVSTNTERQYEMIRELQRHVAEVVQVIEGMNGEMERTAVFTKDTIAIVSGGIAMTSEIRDHIELIVGLFRRISDNISVLKGYSEEVGQLNSSVRSIAGQTSLLALNASIEAARAGDNGRGFAVVASEVSKLSSETNQVSERIESVIQTLQTDLLGIANSIENEASVMTRSYDAIVTTTDAFQGVQGSLNQVVERISGMQNEVRGVMTRGTEMEGSTLQLSEFSEEITAQMQETAAQVQVQTREMERLGKMTETLAGSADRMLQNVANQAMEGHMLRAAKEIRRRAEGKTVTAALLQELLRDTRVDVIYITDAKGVVRYCNEEEVVGLDFYAIDPQSYNRLRDQRPEFIATPVKKRVEDGQLFKFLAVMGSDGIIYQAGMSLKSLLAF